MEVTTSNMKFNDKPMMYCVLWEGIRQHKFGSFLTPVERDWLVAEVSDYLDKR